MKSIVNQIPYTAGMSTAPLTIIISLVACCDYYTKKFINNLHNLHDEFFGVSPTFTVIKEFLDIFERGAPQECYGTPHF